MLGAKSNESVAISDLTQKTQRTGSEFAIMNFKTPNICAKRAEKMQYLVYFEQIYLPKIPKMSLK